MPQRSATRPTQRQRSAATTGELVVAARAAFARDGFAATSLDAICERAGVSKGALYHHFRNKQDLFRAVYEAEQRHLADAIVAAYRTPGLDSWQAVYEGCRAFLEASLNPSVQRITLLDAPGALGWESLREMGASCFRMLEVGVARAMDDGWLARRPATPLAHLLFGAVSEGAMAVARAPNQAVGLSAVLGELRALLDGLKSAGASTPRSTT